MTIAAATAIALWVAVAARGATTFTVTTINDSDDGSCTASLCSLRDAVKYSSAGDTVVVPGGTYTLSIGELDIGHNLTINGAGSGSVTISGNDAHRVFEVAPGQTVTISGVTVTHGNGTGGTISDGNGGAIGFSSATVTLINSVVSNSAANNEGGGIYDSGTMTIRDSTIIGNKVTGGAFVNGGGGLAVEDMLTMSGSTITGNTSTSHGGGIYGDDVTVITNSTITANTADVEGGGFWSTEPTLTNVTIASNSAPSGANVFFNTSSGSLQNTIVSGPSGGGNDCDSNTTAPTSGGHNLEDDSGHTCAFTGAGDQSGVDPKLGPLASNGGPTQTMELLAGSTAVDTGATVASVTTDQRGGPRPQGSGYDIGAYERSAIEDVGISDPPSPNPVSVGGTLTYILTVTNNGPVPEPALAVTVTDTLPSSVTLQSASPSQGTCTSSSGTVSCSLGGIDQGASATTTIKVTPNSAGTITNTATVSTSARDDNPSNDSVTDSVQAVAAGGGAPPSAVTESATGLSSTSVILRGSVNPNGSATTYVFQFGRTTGYGSQTSSQSAGSGTSVTSVSHGIAGLRPGTLYHYRIVAQNANGRATGSDRTFRTPPRASLHVKPSRVRAGAKTRVFGNAGACRRGNRVTLISRAFSPAHKFAGVPAIFATVKAGGAFSTRTRIPVTRGARRYLVTARCGGGNLGVTTHLRVLRRRH
jgi:uncharacterized repeat protein (TIGR01451 family)/CSLREA domain-containing protein